MNYLERLVERYPALDGMKDTIEEAFQIMKASYENGGQSAGKQIRDGLE